MGGVIKIYLFVVLACQRVSFCLFLLSSLEKVFDYMSVILSLFLFSLILKNNFTGSQILKVWSHLLRLMTWKGGGGLSSQSIAGRE